MRHRKDTERLLREYVRSVLAEDEAGGNPALFGGAGPNAYDASFGFMGGSGDYRGAGGNIFKLALEPFSDFLKTVKGASKEVMTKVATAAKVVIGTVVSIIMPTVKVHYDEVFADEEARIREIRGEYDEALRSTDQVFKESSISTLALLMAPKAAVGVLVAKEGPKVALGFLDGITGGLAVDVYKGFVEKAKSAGRWALKNESTRRRTRSLLREDAGKIGPEDILKDPGFWEELKGKAGGELEEAQRAAADAHEATLSEIKELLDATVKEDLNKVSKLLKNEKLKKPLKTLENEMPPEKLKESQEEILKSLRAAIKAAYAAPLKKKAKAAAAIDPESKIASDYKGVLDDINKL